MKSPANTYAALSVDSGVRSADPHRLILLLFEGADNAILLARQYDEQHNIAGRGNAISKAIDIITNGLKASLDVPKGGELAVQLAALYDYMNSRLLWANMKNDMVVLEEVRGLLGEIHDAWKQISPDKL